MRSYYDPSANELKLARIGSRLMDIAAKMPMKGLKDAEIARSNRMASFGDGLTRVGTPFGPKTLSELLVSTGVTQEEATEFVALGKIGQDV